MKIAYTSDLHVSVSPRNLQAAERIAGIVAEASPDVVVLAGDLGDTLEELETVFRYFSPVLTKKLFVPGNHDLWVEREKGFGEGSDSGEKYASLIPALCERNGFVDIGHGPFYFENTAFVGSIGWYDYSFADPLLGLTEEEYKKGRYGDLIWWDRYNISWRRYPHATGDKGLSDIEICTVMVEKLEAHIFEAEKHADRIVAVIHTCPFIEVFSRSKEPSYYDAFQGSERLGSVLQAHKKVEVCLTGHKHEGGEWNIGGIRVCRRILGSVGAYDLIEKRARDAAGIIDI